MEKKEEEGGRREEGVRSGEEGGGGREVGGRRRAPDAEGPCSQWAAPAVPLSPPCCPAAPAPCLCSWSVSRSASVSCCHAFPWCLLNPLPFLCHHHPPSHPPS